MGLLLKEGIDINLIKSAFLAFSIIGFLITLINIIPTFKNRLPNYTLQLAGLIGNTSFLGIPIALALLPSTTINFTIGFDLGTTLFAWIFGPFFLQEKSKSNNIPNIKGLLNALVNSPASRGIIGVLLAYLFQIDEILGDYLWIPARIVIALAIIIVGTRLGIITNQKDKVFDLNQEVKFSILLKLFILPLIVFLISKLLNFDFYQSSALILQAGTPTAISTILMAEAYDLMKRVKGMNGQQMSEVFGIWNNTDELASYLVEITEICLNTKDEITGDDVVEKILDKAGQKGTGLWTVVSALELGVSVPTIYASLNARVMSSLKEQRSEIEKTIQSKEIEDFDLGNISDGMKPLFDAVVLATIASYAQGMDILREASAVYNYGLNMPSIAQIWKGGCIIRSKLLSKIQDAYNKDPDLKNLIFDDWFNNEIATRLDNLAKVVSLSTKAGIPVPCLSSTLDYLNSYRTNRLPQNLVQAMRDCFGSHTYERIDREGSFHTEWMK